MAKPMGLVPVLPFTDKNAEKILKGVKTQTSRLEMDPDIVPGTVVRGYANYFADLEITDIYEKKLGEFDEDDAKRSGGYTLREFKGVWEKIYGKWDDKQIVYVHRFRLLRKK